MIVKYNACRTTQPSPGVTRRIMAYSPAVMLTEHTLEKGAILPEHSHPHQQLIYFISGKIALEMGEARFELEPGDSLVVPPNQTHKVIALEKSVALDVFTPYREDYL